MNNYCLILVWPVLTGSSEQGCPNEEDIVWRIQWPATAPDSTQSVACPGDGNTPELGMAHRRCLAGGVWGSVNALECESVAVNTNQDEGRAHSE